MFARKNVFFILLLFCFNLIPINGYGEKVKIEKIFSIESESVKVPLDSVRDISVDKNGNIYILDSIKGVYQFGKEGNFKQIFGKSKFYFKDKNDLKKNVENLRKILREEGIKPYEMLFPQKFYLKDDKLYILDKEKVCIYSIENTFLGSFSLNYIKARDIYVNVKNEVVIGGIKKGSDKIFHVFDKKGNYIYSFAEHFEIPSKFKYSLPENFDTKMVSFPICTFYFERDDEYYLMNPFEYEIRIYKDRKLEKIIKNEKAFYMPPQVIISYIGGKFMGGSVGYISPPKLFRINDYTLIFRVQKEAGEECTIVDIFKDNIFINSCSLNSLLSPIHMDSQGYLYCLEKNKGSQILSKYLFLLEDQSKSIF